MRRLILAVAILVASSPVATAGPQHPIHSPQGASGSGSGSVSVRVDRTAIQVTLGGRFSFSSTIHNLSGHPVSGLIAHLNVLSSDPDTYVDPEDWSTRRSQFLDALAPAGSVTLTWPMQAVNSGPLVLYVAVTDTHRGTVTASDPISLTVEKQETLNAEGILPLAIGMPGLVVVIYLAGALRRRRAA